MSSALTLMGSKARLTVPDPVAPGRSSVPVPGRPRPYLHPLVSHTLTPPQAPRPLLSPFLEPQGSDLSFTMTRMTFCR